MSDGHRGPAFSVQRGGTGQRETRPRVAGGGPSVRGLPCARSGFSWASPSQSFPATLPPPRPRSAADLRLSVKNESRRNALLGRCQFEHVIGDPRGDRDCGLRPRCRVLFTVQPRRAAGGNGANENEASPRPRSPSFEKRGVGRSRVGQSAVGLLAEDPVGFPGGRPVALGATGGPRGRRGH